jgi:hypothetical protein
MPSSAQSRVPTRAEIADVDDLVASSNAEYPQRIDDNMEMTRMRRQDRSIIHEIRLSDRFAAQIRGFIAQNGQQRVAASVAEGMAEHDCLHSTYNYARLRQGFTRVNQNYDGRRNLLLTAAITIDSCQKFER